MFAVASKGAEIMSGNDYSPNIVHVSERGQQVPFAPLDINFQQIDIRNAVFSPELFPSLSVDAYFARLECARPNVIFFLGYHNEGRVRNCPVDRAIARRILREGLSQSAHNVGLYFRTQVT
jgi:hypothetical protein